MTAVNRTSWEVCLGDVTATISAPTVWAHEVWAQEQRTVLDEFLAGPVGLQRLGALRMDVHLDDQRVRQLVAAGGAGPDTRRIDTIPGVSMIEAADGPRSRVLTVAADELEHQHGTHAVRVTEVDDAVAHIELLIGSSARQPHRLPLRVLREAMIRIYENAGATMLHAAGAAVRHRGVMICGPRFAGKTTTLAALLAAAAPGELLSNDRLLLLPTDRAAPLMVAVPLPVPVARGTIDAVAGLRAALATARRPQPPLDSLPRVFGSRAKAELTAREFATAMNGRLTPAADLRLIVVPRLTDTDAPFSSRHLPAGEARAVLGKCCFTPHDEFWLTPWLIAHRASTDELIERSQRHITTIVATSTCVEISFGVHNPFAQLVDGLRPIVEELL